MTWEETEHVLKEKKNNKVCGKEEMLRQRNRKLLTFLMIICVEDADNCCTNTDVRKKRTNVMEITTTMAKHKWV